MIKKIFFFIISFTLLFGCGSKKTVTEFKEVIKRDSIYIIKDRFITQKVIDTLVVDSPCDSVTGTLKDFEKEIRTNNAKVTLKSVKGSIQVSVNIDSIVSSKITEFKQNYKVEKEIKEVEIVRYKTPFWLWMLVILEGFIIFLLFRLK
tara:strand:- start:105 stop:548 length:444 start_codon:yes stop_codon:yes gene_type:complete